MRGQNFRDSAAEDNVFLEVSNESPSCPRQTRVFPAYANAFIHYSPLLSSRLLFIRVFRSGIPSEENKIK